jgi:polyisoprenoid-binding protein YceI
MQRSLFFLLTVTLGAPVLADEWRSNSAATLSFSTTFEGEPLQGEFSKIDVVFAFDTAAPEAGKLDVTIDLTAADMGDPDMNSVLMDPAWFDTAQFAEANFVSDTIARLAANQFQASGGLELKGTQKNVVVPFSWDSDGDVAHMRGSFDLTRTDFGIGSGEWATDDAIGFAVHLSFDLTLNRAD